MGQDVLTPAQEKVIRLVAREPRLAELYLSGGTALAAYHLHHRISDDLDFLRQMNRIRYFFRVLPKQ